MEAEEVAPALSHYLLLEVDGRRVALPVAAVLEVLPSALVERTGTQPGFLEGYLNLRGRVLPVLSLRERLGLSARAASVDDHLVRVDGGEHEVVVRVDEALDVIGVDAARLQPVDEGPGLAGAVATASGVLLIRDPAAFLSRDEARRLAADEP